MGPSKAFIISIISISYFAKGVWCAYVSNTFYIRGDSERVLLPEGEVRNPNNDFYDIFNAGSVTVWAVVQTKPWAFGEFYDRTAVLMEPRNHQRLPIPYTENQNFYQLVIRNREDMGAIVYASVNGKFNPVRSRSGDSSYLNINTNNLLKAVASFGAGYIPVVGGAISALIDFFWPVATPDIWSEMSSKVEAMIGEKTIELVSNILSSKVRRFSRRLQGLNMEINMRKENESKIHIANHYLNLAQDMFGLEEDFLFDRFSPKTKKMNFQLLPFYVKVVSLQVEVYNFGITQQKLLGLDDVSVRSLNMYKEATLYTRTTGAIDYINTLYSEHQKTVFDECPDAEEIYNCMANLRNYVKMNGLDYISRWSQPLIGEEQKEDPYQCRPFYSQYLGRPCVLTNAVGSQLYEPKFLSTGYFNGRCSRMVRVRMFQCGDIFCGMETTFNDDRVFQMGQKSGGVWDMELETRTIRKFEVYGSGIGSVAGLAFTFTNGKRVQLLNTNSLLGTFEMEGYYISAIMVRPGDANIERDGIANAAVSYLPDGH